MQKKHHIIVVAGPTASGKSDFAVELALKENGEVISVDSRQVYKGLDIGTGKITKEEMKGVPHHMLDIYELGEHVSVARFKEEAEKCIQDIFSRNKTPIVCGGTGQYIDALIYTTNIPKIEPDHNLRKELEKKSSEELYDILMKKDPRRGKEIDSHNRVRLIRALEIVEKVGAVPALETPTLRFDTTLYLMNPTRERLKERIIKRIHKRLEQGMVEEVKAVVHKGYSEAELKRFGIEYFVIAEYIKGEITKEKMVEILTNKCTQYAKRQQTWNKKYESIAILVDVQ